MTRPPKIRRVEFMPQVNYFKPAGIPRKDLEEVILAVEELEAIRLKDLEGLEQEEAAERMQISRPTYQRILVLAREKVADALINGKALRVEGGAFKLASHAFICPGCGRRTEDLSSQGKETCPECGEEILTCHGRHRRRRGARRSAFQDE